MNEDIDRDCRACFAGESSAWPHRTLMRVGADSLNRRGLLGKYDDSDLLDAMCDFYSYGMRSFDHERGRPLSLWLTILHNHMTKKAKRRKMLPVGALEHKEAPPHTPEPDLLDLQYSIMCALEDDPSYRSNRKLQNLRFWRRHVEGIGGCEQARAEGVTQAATNGAIHRALERVAPVLARWGWGAE